MIRSVLLPRGELPDFDWRVTRAILDRELPRRLNAYGLQRTDGSGYLPRREARDAGLASRARLEPHPEGGYFRRIYTAPHSVELPYGSGRR